MDAMLDVQIVFGRYKQRHKNDASNIEQFLLVTPLKQQLYDRLHPSRKLWKLDEQDMRDTAGEVG